MSRAPLTDDLKRLAIKIAERIRTDATIGLLSTPIAEDIIVEELGLFLKVQR